MQDAADIIIPTAASHAKQAPLLSQNCHAEALGWLCRTAGQAALTTTSLASRLVSIPNPARFAIIALAEAGVRVEFTQLASTCATATAFLHVLIKPVRSLQQAVYCGSCSARM
jgi:hypothetical protein